MQIYDIPGKMVVTWDTDTRAIIDTWTSYVITVDEFKTAVLDKGLEFAKRNNGQAWIVDSSRADGNFSDECQKFINSDIFPAFKANGIKFFLTITSESALTNLTIMRYQMLTGPHGLKLVEASSTENAIRWLKLNS